MNDKKVDLVLLGLSGFGVGLVVGSVVAHAMRDETVRALADLALEDLQQKVRSYFDGEIADNDTPFNFEPETFEKEIENEDVLDRDDGGVSDGSSAFVSDGPADRLEGLLLPEESDSETTIHP